MTEDLVPVFFFFYFSTTFSQKCSIVKTQPSIPMAAGLIILALGSGLYLGQRGKEKVGRKASFPGRM